MNLSEKKASERKSDEEIEKEEMDCAEDEKYLEKVTKEREWDDWKDGLYMKWCLFICSVLVAWISFMRKFVDWICEQV